MEQDQAMQKKKKDVYVFCFGGFNRANTMSS